jgi:hypothetical protein
VQAGGDLSSTPYRAVDIEADGREEEKTYSRIYVFGEERKEPLMQEGRAK